MRIRILWLIVLCLAPLGWTQDVQWVGNTRLYATGVGALPTRGSFLEPGQTLTVTTETWPISSGQRVFLVVSRDGWQTSSQTELAFDAHQGNNTRWFGVLGPDPMGTQLEFYVRAEAGTSVRYDNNATQNFGIYARYAPRYRNAPILQWFETDYVTILRRLPEVVKAGYGAIYLPPPSKAGGGGFSTGYNPFDRFDLGDRPVLGTVPTQYGTSQQLWELVRIAHRLGLEVYVDAVYNHSDNRASSTIDRYPGLLPEDFHIRSSEDPRNDEVDFNDSTPFTHNLLSRDLLGLADLAHENGNTAQQGPFNLPTYATWNLWGKPSFVRHPRTPQYYPSGVPASEDVREMLHRWSRLLVQSYGIDGLRLDAVKHMPPGFFDRVSDQPGPVVNNGDLLPVLFGIRPDLYVFGEDFTSHTWELREYAKSGMNLTDFPLKFALDSVFNAAGFGDLSLFANPLGLDPATGLAFAQGGLGGRVGTAFVQSHDQGPPQADNLAHALVLTREARPIVYFDGNNVQPGDWGHFPRPGRYDALGAGGDTVLRQVDARVRFARGTPVVRWSSANLLVYERVLSGRGLLLVGLNIRGDFQAITQTVPTALPPGTRLQDLGGQQPDVVVAQDGRVTLTVPSNSVPGNSNNARGYVLYAPIAPAPLPGVPPLALSDVQGVPYAFAEVATPGGAFGPPGTYPSATVPVGPLVLSVRTDAAGVSAFAKLDDGLPMGGRDPLGGTAEGLTDGYVPLDSKTPGTFSLSGWSTEGLDEGLHVLRVRVFADTGADPGVFQDFTAFFEVRAQGERQVDGDLTDFGAPLTTQTRTPSSQNNRLDAMFAANDDRYLYIGLAGRVSTERHLTNGAVLWIDLDPGRGTGVRAFGSLDDDSGPAPRLLSNAAVTGPAGFGAEYAWAAMQGAEIHSAPGLGRAGSPWAPPLVGSFAGFYALNAKAPRWLQGSASAASYLPRIGPFDPMRGYELAIPLRSLFPQGIPPGGDTLGFLAYACTTGEATTPLAASDPLRAVWGGYAEPRAWVTNQFLPPQPSVTTDPGTGSLTVGSSANYVLRRAAPAPPGLAVSTMRYRVDGLGNASLTVRLRNGGGDIAGPVWLLVEVPEGVEVAGGRGPSLTVPGAVVVRAQASGISAGDQVVFTLSLRGLAKSSGIPAVSVRLGEGLL